MDARGRPVVFMFGGQGSQHYHMGRELFDADSTFRTWLLRGDELFRRVKGRSLIEVMFDRSRSRADPFDHISETHPAIVLVEFALAQALLVRGVEPDVLIGYSLGEFAAAAVSGVAPFEDVFMAVLRQAELVVERCSEAGMTAIIGDVRLFHDEPRLFAGCELVSVNFERHFVVAGSLGALAQVEAELRGRNVLQVRLPVRYGFHSRWLDPLARVSPALQLSSPPAPPRVALISCATTGPVSHFDHRHIWQVIRTPVRFADTIEKLEHPERYVYVDLSPSGTLATFVKNILPGHTEATVVPIMTPFGGAREMLSEAITRIDAAVHGGTSRARPDEIGARA
ncbi:acyltransferase domain-containing protein [Sorangium sp. So ce693]|uniref:acyltransferase domain-containing protein n=1 Tax=Sorangium sp. So ce693 TaxID=3133318 RepID=UPI003F60781D